MLVGAHITGLRRSWWRTMMEKREKKYGGVAKIPAQLKELLGLEHVPVEEMDTRTDLSGYVKKARSIIDKM